MFFQIETEKLIKEFYMSLNIVIWRIKNRNKTNFAIVKIKL